VLDDATLDVVGFVRGESEVEALLAAGELQKLTGEAANGQRLLEKAAVTLETARSAVERDPDSAFVLAYDAARQALTGLLAHQGLRPTTKGGHHAVEQAARAQFGPGFRQFGALRRRRNELEYPDRPDDDASVPEAAEAVDHAQSIITAAGGLVEQLGLF
jgi:HEPN domain-containing protein